MCVQESEKTKDIQHHYKNDSDILSKLQQSSNFVTYSKMVTYLGKQLWKKFHKYLT